ncbi:hypothetical protein Rleg_5424 (plasmid) [Rhizobium leguminosarum bv. trifolii WSM1325]|uniref:Uncharacterized protein n=1 Tax=Rhizobium leguminosarum bv. trifolii (strain WSM1325) TaxID=395491 RepID=C6B8L3_RHILS|nr:hypothetical protein [Rhizobium leguminosarum]ACS60251.1 hypothetical protein Rleg_5424 [Rhizobium leguminosarum bv. trifolii WSM1325]
MPFGQFAPAIAISSLEYLHNAKCADIMAAEGVYSMSLLILITSGTIALAEPASPPLVLLAEARAQVVDCSDAVDEILMKTQGRLLSIRPHADRCTVVVLITREGERPQKKIFRVSPVTDQSEPH